MKIFASVLVGMLFALPGIFIHREFYRTNQRILSWHEITWGRIALGCVCGIIFGSMCYRSLTRSAAMWAAIVPKPDDESEDVLLVTTVHPLDPSWIAHVKRHKSDEGGRIEAYRDGAFAGCLFWKADGTVRSMEPKLVVVEGWLRSLIPASGSGSAVR